MTAACICGRSRKSGLLMASASATAFFSSHVGGIAAGSALLGPAATAGIAPSADRLAGVSGGAVVCPSPGGNAVAPPPPCHVRTCCVIHPGQPSPTLDP